MLDPQDQKLLAQLQRDSRQSNQELADRVGMSPSACWRRVDSLEKTGVIPRYTVLVDRAQAGFAMSAIIHVSLDRHDEKFVTQFVSRVKQRPGGAPNALALLKADWIQADVGQRLYREGYEGVKAAIAAAKGEPVPARIDTGFQLITSENLDRFSADNELSGFMR